MQRKIIFIILIIIIIFIGVGFYFYTTPHYCSSRGTSFAELSDPSYNGCDCIGIKKTNDSVGNTTTYCYGIRTAKYRVNVECPEKNHDRSLCNYTKVKY